MSKVQIVKIPEEVRDKIQMLQYEYDSKKELLTHMINAGVNIENEAFKTYESEYQKVFVNYNNAKQDMQTKYLEPAVPGKLLKWNLNFFNAEATCEYEAD